MTPFKNRKIRNFLEKYRRIWAISSSISLLQWDMKVNLPELAFSERGEVIAELESIKSEFYSSREIRNIISELEKEKDLNDVEKGLVRVVKRSIDYYTKIPKELLIKEEKLRAKSYNVWIKAKKRSQFSIFGPYLKDILEIERKKAEYLGYKKHPYDALLDLYEEGYTTKDYDKIFRKLEKDLLPFYKKYEYSESHPLEKERFRWERAVEMVKFIIKKLGYPQKRGHLGFVEHPMTIKISHNDVRITIWRTEKDFKRMLFAGIHEFGHALYELQIMDELKKTPLDEGVSYGIHESQSRFWENFVGRTREFIEVFHYVMEAFLPFLENYSLDEIYRYFTMVRPHPIRVESDELQYNFHILIRYRIEKGLFEEKYEINELPEIWNEMMEKYIGIKPKNDSEGILQDVHWSLGYFGYFPTYTLGNCIAAQLYYKYRNEFGLLEETILNRDFEKISEFLREKVHKWGAIYPPKDLIKKSTGKKLDPGSLVKYLKEKYGK